MLAALVPDCAWAAGIKSVFTFDICFAYARLCGSLGALLSVFARAQRCFFLLFKVQGNVPLAR